MLKYFNETYKVITQRIYVTLHLLKTVQAYYENLQYYIVVVILIITFKFNLKRNADLETINLMLLLTSSLSNLNICL